MILTYCNNYNHHYGFNLNVNSTLTLTLTLTYVNHQCSVHPIFQRVTYHRFFEKIQIYCFLILCGILPLLVTRDITTWKECVINMLSIHNPGENIFNVNSKVNIVQLTCLKQPEHECNVVLNFTAVKKLKLRLDFIRPFSRST